MLKMFIVHAPASPFGGSRFICRQAAPYALLVSHLRQKCYGVTSGNSPFVNLRSALLFLRFHIACMSELIRTISALLSARSSNISRHSGVVLEKRLFTLFRCQHTENPQKPLLSYLNIITPSLLLGVFYSRKSLFRLFVILTIIILLLKLLFFIATYRQLYKKRSNSVMPRF